MNKQDNLNRQDRPQAAPPPYRDNYHHLGDELKRLDLLIRRRVMCIKHREAARSVELEPRPYVSDREMHTLLEENPGPAVPPGWEKLCQEIDTLQAEIDVRVAASMEAGVFLALPHLARRFGLSVFETGAVLVCLAPELRRKYDKIFVYLQDDIRRSRPSIDLVLDLLCDTEAEKWACRRYFSPQAPLRRLGILETVEDVYGPTGSSGLRRFSMLDRRILNFLLGHNHPDERLTDTGIAELHPPGSSLDGPWIDREIETRVSNIARGHLALPDSARKPLFFYFHGLPGVGKFDLARGLCGELGVHLLCLDLEAVAAAGAGARGLLRLAFREALLMQVVIYIRGGDLLQGEDPLARGLLTHMTAAAAEFGWIVILAGERPWSAAPGVFRDSVFYGQHLPVPAVPLRERTWKRELQGAGQNTDKAMVTHMARQFRLTPGQIREAVESAYVHDILGSGGETAELRPEHLTAAARGRSNQKLTQLAAKISSRYHWDDIVLPEEKRTLLQQICGQVKHRHQVMEQWGFGAKTGRGNGLSVLFTGPPGTGKTMAAGVMARDLQLDLYKIDLSAVVSKYIGETEKNLSRIFQEAETSNAILFFDEADALFGKRSEVNDAHDRYANIETGYLLQRMEEYEGIVILATNIRKNMDEAFTRRIRYIVDFPFPGVESRERIWKTQFPELCPRSASIDYHDLARRFPVTGGHIRNVVLDAAFNAAGNGGMVGMDHLVQGVRKEYEKIGKLWTEK